MHPGHEVIGNISQPSQSFMPNQPCQQPQLSPQPYLGRSENVIMTDAGDWYRQEQLLQNAPYQNNAFGHPPQDRSPNVASPIPYQDVVKYRLPQQSANQSFGEVTISVSTGGQPQSPAMKFVLVPSNYPPYHPNGSDIMHHAAFRAISINTSESEAARSEAYRTTTATRYPEGSEPLIHNQPYNHHFPAAACPQAPANVHNLFQRFPDLICQNAQLNQGQASANQAFVQQPQQQMCPSVPAGMSPFRQSMDVIEPPTTVAYAGLEESGNWDIHQNLQYTVDSPANNGNVTGNFPVNIPVVPAVDVNNNNIPVQRVESCTDDVNPKKSANNFVRFAIPADNSANYATLEVDAPSQYAQEATSYSEPCPRETSDSVSEFSLFEANEYPSKSTIAENEDDFVADVDKVEDNLSLEKSQDNSLINHEEPAEDSNEESVNEVGVLQKYSVNLVFALLAKFKF